MADSRNKPSTDSVVQAVAACLSRHAGPGQTVLVGFSGGLDSTVLLHAATRVVGAAGLGLAALHVHHGLSRNADAWAAACGKFCGSLGIPVTVLRVQVPARSGEGLEAAARRLRHKALSDQPADWVLLAHHADDQAETVLHNLLRGSGVRGAAAMPESRGRTLRPLLGLGRAILLEYAQNHRLEWIEDESNSDLRYTRNFLRRELIPAIESRFPRASAQLAAAAGHFRETDALLDDLAVLDLGPSRPEFPLPLTLFRQLSDARARNLLRAMLGWHKVQPPDERRLKEFVRQLRTAGKDRHPRLDLSRYALWCQAGSLHFKVPD
jgi:tRNA(Ile)-lysidine synthase